MPTEREAEIRLLTYNLREWMLRHPGIRLGQLVSVLSSGDSFYTTDGQLLHCLEEWNDNDNDNPA